MSGRGPAGPKGDRGETGARGPRLPKGIARAVVYLFVLSLVLNGANLYWTSYTINQAKAAQRAEQAAARRAGEIVEHKLCVSFGRLAALQPPPGNPAANPSRAYLQAQHARLDELGTDLGCHGGTP